MKVLLKGAKDEFDIELKSPEEQLIDDEGFTQWQWYVKPLKGGRLTLVLTAIFLSELKVLRRRPRKYPRSLRRLK